MKSAFFAFSVSMILAANAFAESAKWMPWNIDWNKSNAKNGLVMPMICDDAYYTGLHVIVPGIEGTDFMIELNAYGGDCRIQADSMSVSTRNGQTKTQFRVINTESCTITIQQIENGAATPRQAVAELSDAC